jgi:2-methylcitrate dehydratase PrpD
MRPMTTAPGSFDTRSQENRYTTALGEFISDGAALDLPSDLIDWMKLVILDALGCGLLGSTMQWTDRIRTTVIQTEGAGRSLLWGSKDRASAANAAMVNGSAVQGFELDDVGPGSHFGSVTLPVALALAEDGAEMSGADLINAIVVGVEVGARVSDCASREPHVRCGFHGPGLFGAFAAAATAGRALGLTASQSTHAISTVAQFTSGIMGVHHGGMGKRLLAGKAAHSGTLAAQLARHGFTNVDNIFECGYGSFPTAFNGGRDAPVDLTKLTEGLGEDFKSYLIKFKFWAARGPIHPSLEAIRVLRAEHPFEPDELVGIVVRVPDSSYKAV